ncbi:MAG: ankyrin repeat domain-containing protein [Blastocatellia bacterium]
MKYQVQASVRWQRTAGRIIVLALLLMMASSLATAQQANQQTDVADSDSLREAARKGDLTKMETLLRNRVPVDSADKKGRTALIDAAAEGQTQAVKLLLQNGAKPDTQDEKGFTALRAAAGEGHSEIVQALLGAGADVNFKHKEGITALMVAAVKGRTDVVRLLTSRGADLKAKADFLGFDALCYASLEREPGTFRWSRWKQGMPKYPETVQALLDAGASPSTCYIDPNYLKNAPGSFAILPIQDLRTADEKKSALELPQKLAESLAKEFKPRKYEILTAAEAQKKLRAGANSDTEQTIEASMACSSLGTDGILQVQLLASEKLNLVIAKLSGVAVSASLTDCKSGRILWKDFDIYTESRGFILAAFVSGARIIAAAMVTKLPPRPKR